MLQSFNAQDTVEEELNFLTGEAALPRLQVCMCKYNVKGYQNCGNTSFKRSLLQGTKETLDYVHLVGWILTEQSGQLNWK